MHALVSQTSEIARSTEELRLAHQVFEHTQEAIAICKTDFTIVRANPAFLERAQTTARELSGRNMMEFLDAGNQDRDPVGERLHRQLIAEGAWQGEVWLRNPKGEVFPNLLTVSAVQNNQGQISQYILTFSDISERVKNEKQMIATLNETFQIQGHTIGIGASVGIALYPDNGMTAEDLMREADAAMYRVKAGGRNNLAYA